MFNNFCKAAVAGAMYLVASLATATPLSFVPSNDTTGMVFSTNSNDGWQGARGIGFTVTSQQTISSVGLYQNLTNIDLHYGLYEINALNGGFSKIATLASGGSNVTTNGLAWIDYQFAPVTLAQGKDYLIDFSFTGSSNQNFFYNNRNVAWTQGAFTALEGTAGQDFGNFVVAGFRVNGIEQTSKVPEPASLALIGAGMLALVSRRRRR
jgi:hypothetical protein